MLVVLPLLAAIFVYMALRLLYSDWEASFVAEHVPLPDGTSTQIPAGAERLKMQGIEHTVSENINLVRKDKNERTEMRFLADRLIHKSSNTSDIDRCNQGPHDQHEQHRVGRPLGQRRPGPRPRHTG
jgi:hypothetical protein